MVMLPARERLLTVGPCGQFSKGDAMTRGFWFWLLMILWVLSVFFGTRLFPEYALYASTGLLLVLFALLGWQVFGPPIKG